MRRFEHIQLFSILSFKQHIINSKTIVSIKRQVKFAHQTKFAKLDKHVVQLMSIVSIFNVKICIFEYLCLTLNILYRLKLDVSKGRFNLFLCTIGSHIFSHILTFCCEQKLEKECAQGIASLSQAKDKQSSTITVLIYCHIVYRNT